MAILHSIHVCPGEQRLLEALSLPAAQHRQLQFQGLYAYREGRHLAFGREVLRSSAREILGRQDHRTIEKIHRHVTGYLNTIHFDFHNLQVYREMGIANAFTVRQQLISERGLEYFARTPAAMERLRKMLSLLVELRLLPRTDEVLRERN